MDRTRNATLTIYECLAVLAALGLQLAALLQTLHGFAAH